MPSQESLSVEAAVDRALPYLDGIVGRYNKLVAAFPAALPLTPDQAQALGAATLVYFVFAAAAKPGHIAQLDDIERRAVAAFNSQGQWPADATTYYRRMHSFPVIREDATVFQFVLERVFDAAYPGEQPAHPSALEGLVHSLSGYYDSISNVSLR